MIAVGAVMRRRPPGDPKGEQTEGQGADVGKHMSGIGQERQTVGKKAGDQFGEEIDRTDN